eukprot:gene30314-26746_t
MDDGAPIDALRRRVAELPPTRGTSHTRHASISVERRRAEVAGLRRDAERAAAARRAALFGDSGHHVSAHARRPWRTMRGPRWRTRMHGRARQRRGAHHDDDDDSDDEGRSLPAALCARCRALGTSPLLPPGAAPLRAFQTVADAFVGSVADELRHAPALWAWHATKRSALMCSVYPGKGARYVRHVDDPEGLYRRKLSLIFYLNEGWEPAHGGCLELYHPGREGEAVPGAEVEARGRVVGAADDGVVVQFPPPVG